MSIVVPDNGLLEIYPYIIWFVLVQLLLGKFASKASSVNIETLVGGTYGNGGRTVLVKKGERVTSSNVVTKARRCLGLL